MKHWHQGLVSGGLMGDLDLDDGSHWHVGSVVPRKRLKSGGLMPINSMRNETDRHTGRLKGNRGTVESASSGGLFRYRTHRKPGIAEKVNEEFKKGGCTGSILESTNGSSNAVTKFNICGKLKIFDVEGRTKDKSPCVLNFISDSTGSRVNFVLDRMENKEAQIDICKDCAKILLDENDTFVGFVLRTPRIIRLDAKDRLNHDAEEVPRVTGLLFVSSDTAKFKEALKTVESCKFDVLPTQEILVNKLIELATLDQIPTQRPLVTAERETKLNFLHKSGFQSLDLSRKSSRSSTGSARKIVIPSSPSCTTDKTHLPKVSTNHFYSRNNNLQRHALSNLGSVRQTRSQTPNLTQSKLWSVDDEAEHETPEKFEPQLCYKFDDGASYIIRNQDFKCLYNHDWINDTILDFFTKFYVEKAVRESIVSHEEVCIMSSFFYTKLISDPADYYGNVKKWVSNSNLFQKKYVVVPININFHWFGCIITNLDSSLKFLKGLSDTEKAKLNSKPLDPNAINELPKRQENGHATDIISRLSSRNNTPSTTEEDDEEVSVSAPIIKILTFDSLRQTHTREIDPLKDFLLAYAKDKHSLELDKRLIKMKTCAVPQQPNMSDCGVHVILNTMKFFENPLRTVEVWRTAKSRSKGNNKIVNEYFERNKRSSARRDLRDILWHLQKEQIKQMEENDDLDENIYNKEEEDGDIEIIEELSKHSTALPHRGTSEAQLHGDDLDQLKNSRLSNAQQIVVESFTNVADSQPSERNNEMQYDLSLNKSQLSSQDENDLIDTRKGTPVVVPVSQRRYLKSSPSKSSNEGVLTGITSPYFRESPLKNRQPVFDDSNMEHLIRSPTLYSLDGDKDVKIRSSPSPQLFDGSASVRDTSPSAVVYAVEEQPQSSVPPTRGDGTVTLSDDMSDVEDVNLIGDRGKHDTLAQVTRKVECEINSETPDGIAALSTTSELPPLARSSMRRRPDDLDSDVIDELSTIHQVEMITSD